MFKSKEVKFISIQEFNKHLTFCKKYRDIVYEARKFGEKYLVANIVVDIVNIYLTYREGGKTVTYTTRLDGNGNVHKITGLLAYQTICKYYKVPNMKTFDWMKRNITKVGQKSQISWIIASSVPLLYSNNDKAGKTYNNCWGYDMTSAYAWALTQPIPDTTQQPRFYDTVKEGEIGFLANGTITFDSLANVIFPLMESPFKRFVNKWFGIKKYGTPEESAKAKQMLNFAVGYMQRTNPFIRNTIVERCNLKIESLIDENTLFSNTDSLVSLVERKDLDIGPNIGQFHLEHKGKFAYIGFNYQWNDAVPTYRGVAKQWFINFEQQHHRKWSILDDEVPNIESNTYCYDYAKIRIVRRK